METVFVVMANDFPECVFAKEDDATQFCKERMDEQKRRDEEDRKDRAGRYTPRPTIYWRWFEFEVRQPKSA